MTTLVEFNEEPNYCLITMDDGKANALSFNMLEQMSTALDQVQQAHGQRRAEDQQAPDHDLLARADHQSPLPSSRPCSPS